MSTTVVLDGELSLEVSMDGECGTYMQVGEDPVVEALEVTENGTYTVGSGVDGFSPVTVNVEPSISSLAISEDGTYTAPGGTDGYNPVTVNTGVATLQAEIESAESISGCDELVSGLTALVSYSNETTGETDTNLSDAVATLASGYGGGSSSNNALAYCKSCYQMFKGSALPSEFVLDFENNSSITDYREAFYGTTGVSTLTLKNVNCSNVTAQNMFRDISASVINLTDCTFAPSNVRQMLSGSNLATVTGEIDLSNATNLDYLFYYDRALKNITIKASTINVSFTITSTTNLTDASLVSIANGLNESVTGKTMTASTYSSKFTSIVGTVANGTFTADENGTVTLSDFITTTKGWTLA